MTTLREAAQQALEALENLTTYESRPSSIWRYFYPSATGDYVNLREFKELAEPIVTALRAALVEPTTCAWHGDEEGAYETSCKHIFQMIDGTPQENDFTHCCFCGKSLVQHPWEDDNDE